MEMLPLILRYRHKTVNGFKKSYKQNIFIICVFSSASIFLKQHLCAGSGYVN